MCLSSSMKLSVLSQTTWHMYRTVHFLHIRAVATCNTAHSYLFWLTFKHKFIFELWSFFLQPNVLYDVVKCISYKLIRIKK